MQERIKERLERTVAVNERSFDPEDDRNERCFGYGFYLANALGLYEKWRRHALEKESSSRIR